MDLKSGYPFWLAKNGLLRTYAPLDENITTDVVVIGGGITGALLARALRRAGIGCVVVDRRNPGWGSTSASTSLLQYELDMPLRELGDRRGIENAVRAWSACRDAVGQLVELCNELDAGDVETRDSLYFASQPEDVASLLEEYQARREHGFDVEWWDQDSISAHFDFRSGGAILSRGAQVDAYRLTHALLQDAVARGGFVFGRTRVAAIVPAGGRTVVRTDRGPSLDCQTVAVACGFESLEWLRRPPKVQLTSTFALASEPLASFSGWGGRRMLWESARPYCYARTTADGRGILGGEDVPFHDEERRDALLPQKVERLKDRWKTLFPRIPLEVAFTWTGTFAETADSLPYVGFPEDQPQTFYALCYGGNGVVFSAIAAEMLAAAMESRRHPCADLFRFDRDWEAV